MKIRKNGILHSLYSAFGDYEGQFKCTGIWELASGVIFSTILLIVAGLSVLLMCCTILSANVVTVPLGVGFVTLFPKLGFRKFGFWSAVADGLCWLGEYFNQHGPKVEFVDPPSQ